MKTILSKWVFALLLCASPGLALAGSEPVELKFHMIANATNIARDAVGKMLDEIEKNADGQIVVNRYLLGEIAQNDEDQITAVMEGALQGMCTGDMVLSWAAPEWISYTSIPFAFENNEHFFRFFLGEKGKELNKKLEEEYGMRFIESAIGARGGRMLTANKAIRKPEDMRGLKFRVPNVIGTVASWEAMGATVIGVPLSELFTALQTGLVNAQENPYANLEIGAFNQVQSHIMETSHQIGPQIIVFSSDFWNDLTPELQEVINNAVKVGMDQFNRDTEVADARIREKFIANGNVIIPRSEIDIDAFKKIINDQVIPKLEASGKLAPGGWDYIQSLK